MLTKGFHLTYCTNIHPGESWADTFANLQENIPKIKAACSPDTSFGIGLRSSHEASLELMKPEKLQEFKDWLQKTDCYVFTFNGFPYGGFHRQVVKDEVHQPDWSTPERLAYTLRLFDILAQLLPEGMDGGISTSPLSYRHWHQDAASMEQVLEKSTAHLAQVAEKLFYIYQETGKVLHLDIEPEPDGILENTAEVIAYFKEHLIPQGAPYLADKLGLSIEVAALCLKNHIRICYDVCHFAVVYEKPAEVFAALEAEGIQIGKIQISAALKMDLVNREQTALHLEPFSESTYLHQVVARCASGKLVSYKDLPAALDKINQEEEELEWRVHFHVPVFLSDYGSVASTQEDILEVLFQLKSNRVTNHLEVETYTWEVLPEAINLDLAGSIIRELQWVNDNLPEK
jgi:hypothetical protein